MKKIILLSTLSALVLSLPGYSFSKEKGTPSPSPSPSPTDTPTPAPKWIPAPLPKDSARNLSFDVLATYKTDQAGSNLFSIGDLYAKRKLDEYSVTTDFQVRFLKNISTSDSANQIDLRLAKITYLEPWLQFSVGRFDLFPILTPMEFFGAYPDMGIHRVDGAMVVLPLNFQIGIQNGEQATAPPLALTVFYTPSLLSASNVVLDSDQAFLLTQLRARFNIMDVDTVWRVNFGWTGTDYFTNSSLNGNVTASLTGEAPLDSDVSVYGEVAAQNLNYINSTDVFGLGAKIHGIATWGPFSLDEVTGEVQVPLENDSTNLFSGGNNFDASQIQNSQMTWFGSVKVRVKAVSITLAVTNNLDDFTLNRVTPSNSSFPIHYPVGPGRELDHLQVPLEASYQQLAGLVTISTDF